MTKEHYKKIYPWVVVALLWVVALLNYMDRQMLSTMKVAMMGDIHELDKAENFGRLMAIFLWIYAIMSPMAGLVADRINRKWLIVGSLAVWSSVTLAMGYTTNFDQLYALRALMGVSEALYIPAGLALIADYHRGTTRSLAIRDSFVRSLSWTGPGWFWSHRGKRIFLATGVPSLWTGWYFVQSGADILPQR